MVSPQLQPPPFVIEILEVRDACFISSDMMSASESLHSIHQEDVVLGSDHQRNQGGRACNCVGLVVILFGGDA